MRILNLSRLTVVALVATVAAHAAGNVVIGGPNAALAPSSGSYSFDGSNWTGYKAAVSNVANFGPSGIVNTTVTTTALSSITAGTLATVNVFVSPWWTTGESSPFHSIIQTYFLGGGSLILLDDSSGRDGIASLLGIPTVGQLGGSWTASSPILNPFGNPGAIGTSGEVGFFTPANITSHGGTVCATNGSGQPTAACFARGAYAAGAGAMIIVADIDTWTFLANYSPLNGNGSFALNGTAFVINGSGVVSPPSPTPTASGAPTLSEWGIILLAILLVGFGCARVARQAPEQA